MAEIANQFRDCFIRLQNTFERHTISPDGYDIGQGVHPCVKRFSRANSDDARSDKFWQGALQVTGHEGLTH